MRALFCGRLVVYIAAFFLCLVDLFFLALTLCAFFLACFLTGFTDLAVLSDAAAGAVGATAGAACTATEAVCAKDSVAARAIAKVASREFNFIFGNL